MQNQIKKLYIVGVSVLLVCVLPNVHADDTAQVPVTPKGTRIISLTPEAPPVRQPNVTMMIDNPIVVDQMKSTKRLLRQKDKSKSKINSTGGSTTASAPNVETIKFAVPYAAVNVQNKGDKFLFIDITDRKTNSTSVNALSASYEMRRLQVEAVRQAAATRKGSLLKNQ